MGRVERKYMNSNFDKKQTLQELAINQLHKTLNTSQDAIEETVRFLAGSPMILGIEEKEIQEVILKIQEIEGIDMDIGSMIQEDSDEFKEWMTPERIESLNKGYWKNYERYLSEDGNYSKNVITKLSLNTDRIISKCGDPLNQNNWDRRGMVVGSVQSGKTSNYIGLITKAADFGYKVIIVIAGIHENLRKQTQERINEGFVGFDPTKKNRIIGVGRYGSSVTSPFSFTNTTADFDRAAHDRTAFRLQSRLQPVVFVIKKNSGILSNLISWLKTARGNNQSGKIDLPLMVIDDEADNASINTAFKNDGKEISKINSLIRETLSLFKTSSYIGYTATPFANIFIDPDNEDEMVERDLFPKDFIIGLEPPSNYFGPKKLFIDEDTNESNKLQKIFDNEDYIPLKHDKYLDPSLPKSLKDAIISFFLINAIRDIRGDFKSKDISMMVNVSVYTDVQESLKLEIYRYVEEQKNLIRTNIGIFTETSKKRIEKLRLIFERYFSDIDLSWDLVREALKNTYKRIKVVSVNQESTDLLEYRGGDSSKEPISVIVVGGFSLSRGLTLEGLTISYFLRGTLMYDTLLQMGRWFGYRNGYEDLCRIWMTAEAIDWYTYIAVAIEELKMELRQLERSKSTPKNFGLKVRSHPHALKITARNKMGSSSILTRQIELAARFIETSQIPASKKLLIDNYNYSKDFVLNLSSKNDHLIKKYHENQNTPSIPGILFREVNVEQIIDFLLKFKSFSSLTNPINPIVSYIEKRENDEMKNWDVFIYCPLAKRKYPSRNIPIGNSLIPVQSRELIKKSPSIIKFSQGKISARFIEKIGLSEKEVSEAISKWKKENITSNEVNKKDDGYPDSIFRIKGRKPLLIIHFIDLYSDPKNKRELHDLDDFAHTGWSISFPPSDYQQQRVEYIVNRTYTQQNFFDDLNLEELKEISEKDAQ